MNNCIAEIFIQEICLVVKEQKEIYEYKGGCFKNSEYAKYSMIKNEYIKLTVRDER
jgi:hypothetical protein